MIELLFWRISRTMTGIQEMRFYCGRRNWIRCFLLDCHDMEAKIDGQITTKRRERPKSVTLQKLQLPTFDGDVPHWQKFWEILQSSGNTEELPAVYNFTYLKGILRGQEAAAISGIAVTDDMT